MAKEQLRVQATALVTNLPPIPQPWSVDELCRRLTEQRSRMIVVHSLDLPSLPFGVWYEDGERDHIIHRAELTGYHRDHVILHEICHMLARHNTADLPEGIQSGVCDFLLEHAMRNDYANSQEELAETFASMVLKIVSGLSSTPVNEFQRRASAMFGGT